MEMLHSHEAICANYRGYVKWLLHHRFLCAFNCVLGEQGTKPVGGTSEDVCEGSHSSRHRSPGVQWSLFKLCKLVHLANLFP